ncbi:hypothetical protein [Pedobacter sp. ASV12]|uniref:hypothetical protein n=1 Tax=Pedobacter sp. ASV12 TaxID=2795120 RepID=UPI0018EC162A|nr:hypothetical protein [Pedobacter sp. ASV12]
MVNKLIYLLVAILCVSCNDSKDKKTEKQNIHSGIKNVDLTNTTWIFHVSDACIDTLVFKPNQKAISYDCELNYAFNGEYSFIRDTLIVSLKDDSHSENNNKTEYFKDKYLISGNAISFLGSLRMSNGQWKEQRTIDNVKIVYRKVE